jgi:plasmid stabilization system protein ParE
MGRERRYKIDVARPAKDRYQNRVLPYIYDNFSFERAPEVDEAILQTIETLQQNPARGRKEKHLEELNKDFRFILHKETKHFEIKVIYYIDQNKGTVYVTDLFPTKMNPERIGKHHKK